MSQLTTSPILVAPAATVGNTLTGDAATPWANGNWVELIASTSGNADLLGITSDGGTGPQMEIDIGIGGSGSEVVVATLKYPTGSIGQCLSGYQAFPFGLALGNNVRIAARTRSANIGNTIVVNVIYSISFDGNSTNRLLYSLPAAADNVSVTPHATAWNNSNYSQITAALAGKFGLLGLAISLPSMQDIDYEIDIAIGAAASEVVQTTIRSTTQTNFAGPSDAWLTGMFELPLGSRVAVRMRKSGTSVTAWSFGLIGLDLPGAGGGPGGGKKPGKGGGGVTVLTPGTPIMFNLPGAGISSDTP